MVLLIWEKAAVILRNVAWGDHHRQCSDDCATQISAPSWQASALPNGWHIAKTLLHLRHKCDHVDSKRGRSNAIRLKRPPTERTGAGPKM